MVVCRLTALCVKIIKPNRSTDVMVLLCRIWTLGCDRGAVSSFTAEGKLRGVYRVIGLASVRGHPAYSKRQAERFSGCVWVCQCMH